jgi:prevent-host-death family protein
MTNVISALTVRTQFGQILRRVKQKNERFLVGRRGEPQAIIIGIDDYINTFAPAPGWLKVSLRAEAIPASICFMVSLLRCAPSSALAH